MRTLAFGTLLSLAVIAAAFPGAAHATAKKQPQKRAAKKTTGTQKVVVKKGVRGTLPRTGLARPKLTAGTAKSGYRRLSYGKDETPDVAAHEQAAYHQWQDSAMHDLELPGGGHAPVAVIEVGPPGPKPTIVHFHGATVQVENVLLWRLARAFQAEGRPIRIIAPRHQDGRQVIDALTQGGEKVAVMGHSAGSGTAQSIAAGNPDKVSHDIGIGSPGTIGRGVKTLLLNGTNGRDGYEHALRLAEQDDSVTALVLDGVDHSMRQAPAGLPGGEQKARFNATPETARVARRVARSVTDFVSGEAGGFFAGVRGSWQGRFDTEE
ncbi:MAG TPA: alpha/beta hydrolase [Kofleriaceae bacterium]|nr:alpha/beta hydrolase [Kofleriaceae bacterium]